MQDKNCYALVISMAILSLIVLFPNNSQAAEPLQNGSVPDVSSGRIQVAQAAAPTMEPTLPSPPSPKKPHPTTGVPGRTMTRGMEPFAQGDSDMGAKFFKSLMCNIYMVLQVKVLRKFAKM